VALRVVRRVVHEGAYSNLTLAAELQAAGSLSDRDRRFASELAYGMLRTKLLLDRRIEFAANRPASALEVDLVDVLRLGAYQIGFTRVPDHAAVAETVRLARPRHRGFVNAVLRRLATDAPPVPRGEDDEAVSLRTGLAAWAVGELRRLLPARDVEPAAAALAAPAELTLRVNRCRATAAAVAAELRADGHPSRRGALHPDVLRLSSGYAASLPGYAEGRFTVQDEASALVVAALDVRPGQRILDVCAGPGGKATHAACLAQPGGLVVGADVAPARAALVTRAAARLGSCLQVLVQDARRPALRAVFDAVLVDAPCSGLGAARRRPELLWRPQKQDLAETARNQVAILDGAAGLVRLGGRLVYSVCTFPRAETEAAVRAFLARRPDFEPGRVAGPDGAAPAHRLWPHRQGTDAMFYAGFRRRSDSTR
jgi:16S rRNA (cytosine967-C5)-methyltransferase